MPMKTAISIPNEIFESAEKLAENMGVSRSELYVIALKRFLEQQSDSQVSEKLNEIYGERPSTLDPGLRKLQSRSLPKEKW